MVAYEVRSYTGNAADTVLNANVSSTALSFSVAPGTGNGYPDGSQGPFYVFLDYDTSGIEKVRCTGRINDTFTIPDTASRGVDGTTAQAHNANAKVRHGWTATDAQEANRAAANTVGKVTTKGDLLVGTGANTLARVGVAADGALLIADSTQAAGVRFAPTGIALDATSSLGGVTGTALGGAWTSYAATFTNFTQGNAAVISRYKQVGKVVIFAVTVNPGSTSSYGGIVSVSLPVQAANYEQQALAKFWNGTSTDAGLGQINASATTVTLFAHLTTGSAALANFAGTSLGVTVNSAVSGNFAVYGTYETA